MELKVENIHDALMILGLGIAAGVIAVVITKYALSPATAVVSQTVGI